MQIFHRKGVSYILMVLASILALITVIMGATQKAMTLNVNFSIPLILSLSAAVVTVAINCFVNWDFLPLVSSILLSLGFGMIVNEGLPVIVDKINDISFQGGSFPLVAAYTAMSMAACVLSFIACFIQKEDNM